MREQLDRLRNLMRTPRINTVAVLAVLDALPIDAGAEIAVLIAQARRAVAQVSSGKDWYKPLLRHAIRRLIVLLEAQLTASPASPSGPPVPPPLPPAVMSM